MTRRSGIVPGLVALALFAVISSEYTYTRYLRHKYAELCPAAWSQLTFNGRTNFLAPWFIDEQMICAAKVHQIQVHGFPYDTYIVENRAPLSWKNAFIPYYILAFLAKPFHFIDNAWVWISYGLFVCWFLVLYTFLQKSFSEQENITGTVIALAALLPLCIIDGMKAIPEKIGLPHFRMAIVWLTNFGFSSVRSVAFLRLNAPLLTLLLLLVWIGGVAHLLRRKDKNTLWFEALLGTSSALFLFIHLFEWTIAVGLLGVLSLAVCFRKELLVYKVSILRLSAIALAASGLVLVFLTGHTDPSVMARVGFVHDHSWPSESIMYLVIGLVAMRHAVVSSSRPKQVYWLLFSSALLGSYAIWNSSMVIGISFQRSHHILYCAVFTCALLAGWIVEKSQKSSWIRHNALGGVLLLLLLIVLRVKGFAEKHYKAAGLPRDWDQAIEFLNKTAKKDEKILTLSANLMWVLPAYTPLKFEVADVFPVSSSIPTEDNLKRMAILLKTLNVNLDTFFKERWDSDSTAYEDQLIMDGNEPLTEVSCERRWFYLLSNFLYYSDPAASTRMQKSIRDYSQSVSALREPFYVWLNPDDRHLVGALEKTPGLELIYQNSTVLLYRYIPDHLRVA